MTSNHLEEKQLVCIIQISCFYKNAKLTCILHGGTLNAYTAEDVRQDSESKEKVNSFWYLPPFIQEATSTEAPFILFLTAATPN